jgi:hypothetical protein
MSSRTVARMYATTTAPSLNNRPPLGRRFVIAIWERSITPDACLALQVLSIGIIGIIKWLLTYMTSHLDAQYGRTINGARVLSCITLQRL